MDIKVERHLYENGRRLGMMGLDLWAVWDDAILEDAGIESVRCRIAQARAESKAGTYCSICERHCCRCDKERQ